MPRIDTARPTADKSAAMPDAGRRALMSPHRFRRLAMLVVAVYVGLAVLPGMWHERDHHDFGQFYMGGAIARAGDWADLYPVPVPGATLNPGWPAGSTPKPGYQQQVKAHRVGGTFRFIQLPPNAILYEPLALMTYQNAYRAWHVVMLLLTVLAAGQAGRIYTAVGGPGTVGPALVTLLVGCSPLTVYTARVSNTGPLLAACVGQTVLGLLQPERTGWGGVAAGVVIGGYTKFAPGVVLPVAVAMRRWRTVAATVVLGLSVAAATMAVTGVGVWREFATVLWPPLQLPSNAEANQTLYGFASRVAHQFPLGRSASTAVALARDVAGLAVLALLARRRSFWDDPVHVAAACAALLAWLLAFAPAAWEFYHCMLTPLWGWLAWEFVRGRWGMRTAVIAAVALTFVPSPGSWWGRLPEPIASRQLFSALVVLALAAWRLRPGYRLRPAINRRTQLAAANGVPV